MTFVLDASVTFAWCFEDEATERSDAILDRLKSEAVVVPGIWPFEVANVLLVAERRGRITQARSVGFVTLLGQLPIQVDGERTDITGLLPLAREQGLSAYDAAYLALAERDGLSLATADKKLRVAAQTVGVGMVDPHL